MAEPTNVLSASALRKTYRSGDRTIVVLDGAELEIRSGESISVRGESGSGKSTLINLLAGLDAPDSGAVSWLGGADTGASRRAKFLGLVFQAFYLIPELDARQNVLLSRRILGRLDATSVARADSLLARVGLSGRIHHLPSQLSGGEQQRVAVARALMNSPRLILADEPTGNLDEKTGTAVVDLLFGLCRETGTATVLVTHNAEHARRADRPLFLREGRLRDV